MSRRARMAVLSLFCVVVLAPSAVAVGPTAGAGTDHRATRVVEFIRDNHDVNASLAASVTTGNDGSDSDALALWSYGRDGTSSPPSIFVGTGGYLAPETNATGKRTGCVSLPVQPAPVCQSRRAGFTFAQLTVPPHEQSVVRIVVVLVGDDRTMGARLLPESTGWRMVTLKRKVTVLRARDVADTWVYSTSETVEHFTHAQAVGGPHGSMAIAGLPCRVAGNAVSTGQGAATLTGAATPRSLSCGASGRIAESAVATRGTTWRLQGDVWGTTESGLQVDSTVKNQVPSTQDIRLLVVDGPF